MPSKTTPKAVRIIDNVETVRLLADPIRREILRYLSEYPMTETQLAARLNLAKSSICHHLQMLAEADLIRVERTEVESHGIQQKFYETTFKIFIIDFTAVPPELQRYFLHIHMERLRGILSVVQLMEEKRGRHLELTRDQLEALSLEVAKQTSIIGKGYEHRKEELNMSRETLLLKIYGESLRKIIAEHSGTPLDALKNIL